MSVQKLRERKAHFFWVWARGYFRIRAWVPTDVRSWVSSVWQLAHSLLVTMTNFQYCKGSYSLAKKHKWMKWLAQASTCGKFMTKTHILWGWFFFLKHPWPVSVSDDTMKKRRSRMVAVVFQISSWSICILTTVHLIYCITHWSYSGGR